MMKKEMMFFWNEHIQVQTENEKLKDSCTKTRRDFENVREDIVWATKMLQQQYLSDEANFTRCERILKALKGGEK